jgi:phosphatidylglycerophosphate synthase
MLDRAARRVVDPWLERLGALAQRAGLSANAMTLAGGAFGIAAAVAIAQQRYGLALACGVVNRLLDGIDGPLARRTGGSTDFGGYLDALCDFVFYSAVPLGFAIADPARNALPAAVLLGTFLCTAASFLAYAAIVARRGLDPDGTGQKSFFYADGLAEGTETIVAFALMCLFPAAFAWIAYAFAALCVLTVIGRLAAASRALR